MNTSDELHYDDSVIQFLELMWGKGYLSPGGADEVARLLEGIDLTEKTVLDIGCGSGGISIGLIRDFGANRVIGLDVEEPVCRFAREAALAAGVADRLDVRQIEPGVPIPIESGSMDIVFSKDSIVHIEDKEALTKDVFRILKPGGWFVASDWLISHDGEPSPEMAAYIKSEDLGFGMASPNRYQKALEEAGFSNIELRNRNRWYTPVAEIELERLRGPERAAFDATTGPEDIDRQTRTWAVMVEVLKTGEHCPHHFRGQKPL
ncbi:MAG: methyltransferase domain-containing protein [Pseudomonadales bacterium]